MSKKYTFTDKEISTLRSALSDAKCYMKDQLDHNFGDFFGDEYEADILSTISDYETLLTKMKDN